MEDKPTLPIEIWRKIGEYGNTRIVINYEAKTLNDHLDRPKKIVDDKVHPRDVDASPGRKATVVYIDLSYQLLLSYSGRTYPLRNLHSCCLFVPKGLHLVAETVYIPLSEPFLCLDHTKRLQRIRDEINNDVEIALYLKPQGMMSRGSFGKSL